MSNVSNGQAKGIYAALTSAVFLGLAPVFGKLSISHGMSPMAVVALRTILATTLLLTVVLIYNRRFLYIYPAGLLGCFLAGGINGVGSLLYYAALGRINASLGQLIYSLYPLFVALWLWLDHQKPSRLTIFRLLLVLPALFLLIGPQTIDLLGVIMMLAAAALYALHLPINQRVLYDMPAPTVTFYTLLAMSAVVVPALLFTNLGNINQGLDSQAWGALIGLTLVTFFSRLTLFMGVKHLGGLQTALLGLGELLITIIFSHVFLHEGFTAVQWLGAALLVASLVTVRFERPAVSAQSASGWLGWLRSPGIPSEFPWQPHN
jgi:drug/metabolite transporter (DMT)-like permease